MLKKERLVSASPFFYGRIAWNKLSLISQVFDRHMEKTTSASGVKPDIEFDAHFESKKHFFDSGETLSYTFRKNKLKELRATILKFEKEIVSALKKDLNKSETESFLTEIGIVLAEIDIAVKHIGQWMKPHRKFAPLFIEPSSSKVHYQPKGVVLIIVPWNYPFYLTFTPLIGAIAAGNCAVVKPSEEAPYSARIIEKIIQDSFENKYIGVVQGAGHLVVPALMAKHIFNHIFFTGSSKVGKIIAKAAANTLTETTLELGGKNPAIIHKTADIKVAARRIAWGKCTNMGQTCVAPDYLLVDPSILDSFIKELKAAITEMYGKNPQESSDYGRMINQQKFKTVLSYLTQGTIVSGGNSDSEDLYIEPTLLLNPDMDAPVMQEEIFGPVLPIIPIGDFKEAKKIISLNPNPLAAYFFGTERKAIDTFIKTISFGGGCINDTLIHLANPNLPFGGIMGSGQGRYHGKYGFECFSHIKALVHSTTFIDPSLRYPPYSNSKMKWLKRLF